MMSTTSKEMLIGVTKEFWFLKDIYIYYPHPSPLSTLQKPYEPLIHFVIPLSPCFLHKYALENYSIIYEYELWSLSCNVSSYVNATIVHQSTYIFVFLFYIWLLWVSIDLSEQMDVLLWRHEQWSRDSLLCLFAISVMPKVRRWVKGPMWLHFLIGVSSFSMLSIWMNFVYAY